ncbi:hypothetical protein LJC49_01465 [Ruminococcaceae bacterium OttesenSCG-928-I18]|nr:hypothetical protein [Ruminococcaceae bacterium OttesenSCG-928-I18]
MGLVVFLNVRSARYIVLYPGLPQEESVQGLAALEEAGISGRINTNGELEVSANQENAAMAQLATVGIPSSTLEYDIFQQAGGLTTTDFEKQQYQINQMQDRLQDIIRTYDGVQNAYVTLNIEDRSNRVWNAGSTPNTASVKVEMRGGQVLTAGQVSGIRFLVGPAAGIDADQVAVIDSTGVTLAAAGEGYDAEYAATTQFLQRQGFEADVEKRLYEKTANILSLPYPESDDYRISITAQLDWDAMITEIMEYTPLEGTEQGVMNHEDMQAVMGAGEFAEGVVGETDNTDVPVYADLDGDGEMDTVDYYHNRDFLVSYMKQQIEKDGATLEEVSVGVMIRGTLNNDTRQTLRELIAAATNVPIENVTVQGMLDAAPEEEEEANLIFGLPALFVYIAAAVLVAMIIAIILILVLRRRAQKKRLAEAEAAAAAEEEEALRVQQEIEERKKQLKSAAMNEQNENAITNEVREFAKTNPEITANLLRNWLREGEA